MSWLHAAPIDDALALGVADQRQIDAIGEARDEAIEELPMVLRVLPDAPIADWRAFLKARGRILGPSAFALVHNDLAAEHVLVDETCPHVTGVIDWSDVAVGDRATDFGGIFHWGGAAFLSAVLAHYAWPVDDASSPARDSSPRVEACSTSDLVSIAAIGSYIEGGVRGPSAWRVAECSRRS